MLSKCYKSSLDLAFSGHTRGIRVASPLLGAGARGFPTDVAMQIAVESCIEWHHEQNNPKSNVNEDAVVFGLLEANDAEDLAEMFEKEK
jgi:O-acetyl-ADP-ribose deacetylase (regulator of RNase III)